MMRTDTLNTTVNYLMYFALLCILSLSGACIKGPGVVYHLNYFHTMNYVTLKKEIVEQEKIIAEYPESSKKSASYFYLALLYAHYNNPKPDYSRSLKMFEEYLLFNPENYKKDEALYLSTLLQEIVKTDRELSLLKTEARRIKQDSVKLKAKNKQLVLENQNLGDSIEKLKLLELTLEEKRLNFK